MKTIQDYNDYLKSENWIKKRDEVIERDGLSCRVCGSTDVLNVHHRKYVKWGNEALEDLITLCRHCHKLFHGVSIKKKNKKKKELTPKQKAIQKNQQKNQQNYNKAVKILHAQGRLNSKMFNMSHALLAEIISGTKIEREKANKIISDFVDTYF